MTHASPPSDGASDVLFHLGFPKSASTTLQRALFDVHPEVNNFGRPKHLHDPDVARLITSLRFSEHFAFRQNADAHETFARELQSGKLNVFSCEDFAMGPYWLTSQSKTADRHSLLLSLSFLAPDARALVIVRDQLKILPSIYTQLRAGGRTKLPEFQTWIEQQLDRRGMDSVLDALDYATYLEAVEAVFGPGRVMARDFDALVLNTERSLAALAQDLGLSPTPAKEKAHHNARRTGLEMRLVNIWKKSPALRRAVDALPKGVKSGLVGVSARLGRTVPTQYGADQERALRAHFGASNDRLRTRWDIGAKWSV